MTEVEIVTDIFKNKKPLKTTVFLQRQQLEDSINLLTDLHFDEFETSFEKEQFKKDLHYLLMSVDIVE